MSIAFGQSVAGSQDSQGFAVAKGVAGAIGLICICAGAFAIATLCVTGLVQLSIQSYHSVAADEAAAQVQWVNAVSSPQPR